MVLGDNINSKVVPTTEVERNELTRVEVESHC
jgi:hypothetical protein